VELALVRKHNDINEETKMNKNNGCEECKLNCKDKSRNGYNYCPDFEVKVPSKGKSNDLPPIFKEIFKGF